MKTINIEGFEINLDNVPDTKKEFVKRFKYIYNVAKYWDQVKKAKSSLKK